MTQVQAMLLSLAIEVPIALVGARAMGADPWRVALVSLGATLVTHPLAWTANERLGGDPWVRLAAIEIAVAVVEGAMYARVAGLGWSRGLGLGALANAASFGAGIALYGAGVFSQRAT